MTGSIRHTATAGLIAAVYVVLGLAFAPISFGVYQVRVAEALTVLPFLTRAAIPGLYVGCLVANVVGGMGWLDIIIGPLITLAAAFLTRGARLLPRSLYGCLIATAPPLLMWLVGAYFLIHEHILARSAAGLAVSAVLVATAVIVERRSASTDQGNGAGLAWMVRPLLVAGGVFAAVLCYRGEDHFMFAVGAALTVASLLTAMLLARLWFTGRNPGLMLAPLPPVILNAFGVSLYLAPIIGVNYWFAVQMIGVGQLVACYLLGVPLILLLQKRPSLFQ